MEESATKGLQSLGLNDKDAVRVFKEISVEGFENCSLQKFALKLVLTKHFASCGKVLYVTVIKSVAFMRIEGEDAEDKALALHGTDVGGWYAIVKAAPLQMEPFVHSSAKPKRWRVLAKGYDIGLPEIDIQIALCEHFSSCGEVTEVLVHPSSSTVTIQGEGCVEKALELSGRDVGGMNLVVEPILERPENVKRKRASRNSTFYMPPPHLYKLLKEKHEIMVAKMEKDEKMEKMKMMDKDKGKV